jgi:hypothetical protein
MPDSSKQFERLAFITHDSSLGVVKLFGLAESAAPQGRCTSDTQSSSPTTNPNHQLHNCTKAAPPSSEDWMTSGGASPLFVHAFVGTCYMCSHVYCIHLNVFVYVEVWVCMCLCLYVLLLALRTHAWHWIDLRMVCVAENLEIGKI